MSSPPNYAQARRESFARRQESLMERVSDSDWTCFGVTLFFTTYIRSYQCTQLSMRLIRIYRFWVRKIARFSFALSKFPNLSVSKPE
jgi:hypothetical protein